MIVGLFFSNRPPRPRSQPQFCFLSASRLFWGGIFLGRRGYCSAVPVDVRLDSNRSPSPGPPSCVRHLSLFNFPLLSPSPQAVSETPANWGPPTRYGESGRLSFLVCVPAYLHDCLCLPISHGPPLVPCCLLSQFFGVSWSHSIEVLRCLLSLETPRYSPILSPTYNPTVAPMA
jgi:hypothetical protein